MHALLPLLIVAINPNAPMDVRYPAATEVYHRVFDESCDKNYDLWPDGWQRRTGVGFPRYVEVGLVDAPSPTGSQCLRVSLDGGGAAASSPAIDVTSFYSYVLEATIQTAGLEHDQAFLSLTFLDKDRQRVEGEVYDSAKITHADAWRKVRLGPIEPRDPSIRSVVIGLHVLPGDREDLQGTASFGEVWFARLPRINLTANRPGYIYTDPSEIRVLCETSGFTSEEMVVRFTLEDTLGSVLAELPRPIRATEATDYGMALEGPSDETPVYRGTSEWAPPISSPGFYRVFASIEGGGELVHQREINLAVIVPQRADPGGLFGWSLPNGDQPLGLDALGRLLGRAGINWVKYPLWFDDTISEDRLFDLSRFCGRMSIYDIELVGLLHDPPDRVRSQLDLADGESAAEIFSHGSELWLPSIETTMLRTARQVRHWQLGRDEDMTFVNYPRLSNRIAQMKTLFDEVGYDVSLGFAWQWIEQIPAADPGEAVWRFLSFSTDPPLTHRELANYLDRTNAGDGVDCWATLSPLKRSHYDCTTRIDDLVRRMIESRIHGASAVFIPDPFDAETGLMNEDGTPSELFLPWRTTALAIGSAQYMDSIQLPGGSSNYVFLRGDEAVLVLWNDEPVEEVIFLGENARQVNLWGQVSTPKQQGFRQVFSVGKLPTFVTGADTSIARWRQAFKLAEDRIPSDSEKNFRNQYEVTNTFDRPASVTVRLNASDALVLDPLECNFRLEAGESIQQRFDIGLPFNAVNGQYPVRVDMMIESGQTHRFSTYRQIVVGEGDIFMSFETHLDDQGRLIVEQTFHNKSDSQVYFNCELAIRGRSRQRADVWGLGYGSRVETYVIENGEELIGKSLRVHASEKGGTRDLNYEIIAER